MKLQGNNDPYVHINGQCLKNVNRIGQYYLFNMSRLTMQHPLSCVLSQTAAFKLLSTRVEQTT